MRAKMYQNHHWHIPFSYGLGILFSFILFFAILLFIRFNQKVSPRLLSIAESSINKLNESILMQYRVSDVYKKIDLEEMISLTKNTNGEIIAVDFQLENAYRALSLITNYLKQNLENESVRQSILKFYSEDLSSGLDSIVLAIPIGVASDGVFLVNLGPRIPVKINYMGYLATSVRIKLEDYGINSVLVSLYIDCSITNEFIVPNIQKEIHHGYSILLASKIIQGTVPEYYGGSWETKSNILNVPID